MDGIQGVLGRIAEIQGRFGAGAAPGAGTGGVLGTGTATGTLTGTGTGDGATPAAADGFAAALARVTDTTATAGAPPTTPGQRLDAAGATRFAHDLLARLGAPATAENVRAVVAWVQAEGTRAAHNPLATTQRMEGATNFNSVGVKDYVSYEQGLDATVRTLRNGRYDAILQALARGDSAEAVARAVAASPWGTGEGVLRVLRRG